MNIRNYEIPDVLGRIEELRVIYTVTLAAIERLRADLAAAALQLDYATADLDGLARLEKIYGLADASGYTEDERRFRLQCWAADIGNYSANNVKDWVETFGGEGASFSSTDTFPPTVTVRIPLNSEKKVADLRRKLEKMLPLGSTVDVSAIYTTFAQLSEQTWNELSDSTFGEIKRGE